MLHFRWSFQRFLLFVHGLRSFELIIAGLFSSLLPRSSGPLLPHSCTAGIAAKGYAVSSRRGSAAELREDFGPRPISSSNSTLRNPEGLAIHFERGTHRFLPQSGEAHSPGGRRNRIPPARRTGFRRHTYRKFCLHSSFWWRGHPSSPPSNARDFSRSYVRKTAIKCRNSSSTSPGAATV